MNRALALVRSDAEAVVGGRTQILDSLRGQHLFISGGTGFLGTWLLELIKVLNERHSFGLRVTVYSRHARSFAAKLPHLGQMDGVRFEEGDIRYFTELPRDVRYIIHAAALTDRRLLASQPSAVAEVNSIGIQRLLKAANLLEDLHKFVLLSSGLVYGAQPWDLPSINESFAGPMRCDDVNAVYAESKRFSEVVAQSSISETKLPIVTLRPFAFVGPYQSLQLPWAVTDFIRDSFTGGPIRIMGDGTTVRSLMYASDYAFWVLAALAKGRPRETYNIGSAEPVDLASLAKMITQSFNPSPEIRTGLGQKGHERNRLIPDIGKAKRDLNLEVTVPLAEAIQRTINWNRYTQSS
ncbi:MAG: NAD(P)-dependent oxidoreductase [Opitutus sp.]|nr:NAD(P)-dependent oxidoreductase [Opitutus sp.]MCS6277752.1 NAD(P)-dependent oxidoreductase [Opitutus sp.]MCS6299142.1 NAD(P)-dependent oxidoreductase [Opitutus sp.]